RGGDAAQPAGETPAFLGVGAQSALYYYLEFLCTTRRFAGGALERRRPRRLARGRLAREPFLRER
ncbi:MAG: hypothetical protein ABI779_20580, partial [Acidobacteriota bacterium]